MRTQSGITLIESLAALALACALMAMAAPMFASTLERYRLRQQALILTSVLWHARSEAVRLNQPVYVCAANLKTNLELQGCLPPMGGMRQLWPEGALAFADLDAPGNGAYNGGERLKLAMLDGRRVAVANRMRQLMFTVEGRVWPSEDVDFWLSGASGHCLRVHLAANGAARLGEVDDGCG
ncbi:Tfp pilus assembly protein FimT/FimU [Chromobacterium sp. IIBBL 290-4]|uniref:pilus assembly FimT family protein n=1 Tax=Chromobacterium sp. IIBBL 290-4 TaxID=2953890 RepID=UPI0020B67C0D|nr:GspH/FimT family pseudopilin [Chromobacterium sp. IIBBL 290-4]UTH75317.1 GspH/FimT family pseudopilin [Chromobacterium sp. IIBBL 290-4]